MKNHVLASLLLSCAAGLSPSPASAEDVNGTPAQGAPSRPPAAETPGGPTAPAAAAASPELPPGKFGELSTVTATRDERRVADSPASLNVVTQEQIQQRISPTLDEALRRETGVYIMKFRGPVDNHTQSIMRGIRGQERTLFLVDDIPLNAVLGGGIPWNEISIDEVKQVEVARGPFSALYGGSAIAGVVNVQTATPESRSFKARAGYGTFGTSNAHLSYGDSVAGGRLKLLLGYDRWQTNGYVVQQVRRPAGTADAAEADTVVSGYTPSTDVTGNPTFIIGDLGPSPFTRDHLFAKLQAELSEGHTLTASAMAGRWDTDTPTFNTYLRDANGNPVVGGTLNIEGRQVSLTERNFFPITRNQYATLYTLGYRNRVSDTLSLKANLAYARQFNEEKEFRTFPTSIHPSGASWSLRTARSDGFYGDVVASIQAHERVDVTVGVSANGAEGTQRIPIILDRRAPEEIGVISEHGGRQLTTAAFAQAAWDVVAPLTLFLGARYDLWQNLNAYRELRPEPREAFARQTRGSFNPKLSAVYRPFASTIFKGSVGTAFRPPTLNELYSGSTHSGTHTFGNPDLVAERLFSYEAGVVQTLPGGTRVSATYFDNRISDLIFARTISEPGAALTVRQNENAAQAYSRGVELEASHRLTRWLDVFGNATLLRARIARMPNNPELEGKVIPLVPEVLYNAGLQARHGPLEALLTFERVGDAFARDDNSDVVNGVPSGQDPYHSVDAKVRYTFFERVTGSVAVRNLTGQRYWLGFGQNPGRTFYGELAFQY
ncbi:MAG TPA: TonB-dependent receptor [Myxococcaceae bacterium]